MALVGRLPHPKDRQKWLTWAPSGQGLVLKNGTYDFEGSASAAITHYLQANKNIASFYKAPSTVKPIYIDQIELLNEQHINLEEFRHDEDIFIRVKIAGEESSMEKYNLLLMILDGIQKPVFAKETKITSQQFLLKINRSFMVRGNYSLTGIVYIPGITQYDKVEDVCSFNITDSGSEFAHLDTFDYGNVFGNANWEI